LAHLNMNPIALLVALQPKGCEVGQFGSDRATPGCRDGDTTALRLTIH
jgi:hypothetical protein